MIEASGWRSLLRVLQIYAPQYVRVGQMYQEYLHGLPSLMGHPTAKPNQAQYDQLLSTLRSLHQQCLETHLVVSARTIERTIHEFEQQIPNLKLSQEGLAAWFSCFTSELETQVFMLVEPTRVPYLPDRDLGAALLSVVSRFPNAYYDAYHAGLCYAFGCFTACVYHLMRTSEHGLVSVAESLRVNQDKISKGWDGCIQGIEAAIKVISSTKPTADWQEQVKKYSDLCSWFTTIKTGWRNPVSHVPRNYSDTSGWYVLSHSHAV